MVSGKIRGLTVSTWHEAKHPDSAFYPPWDGKMSTSQRAVMFCGWGVKAGMV